MSVARGTWAHAIAVLLVLVAVVATLAAMGRPWWCAAGDPNLWSGEVWSRHNSQHLFDPYTFTHALHGLVYYALVWGVMGDRVGPIGRWWIAFAVEALWEVGENTDTVIERYRAATISLDYYGDSVANSIGDILAYVVGYRLATVLPVSASVAVFVLVDSALALWIRDGLLLNVVMLVHPIEAVRLWQMRGHGG